MFRNLTPHKITVFGNDGSVLLELEPELNFQARVQEFITTNQEIEDIPIVTKRYTQATLPFQKEGVYLIVSKMVIDAHPERQDLLCPDTGPDSVVRDEQGHILGVKRLQAAK